MISGDLREPAIAFQSIVTMIMASLISPRSGC